MITFFAQYPWVFWSLVAYCGVGVVLGLVMAGDESGNSDADTEDVIKCFFWWLCCWGYALISTTILDPLREWWGENVVSSDASDLSEA